MWYKMNQNMYLLSIYVEVMCVLFGVKISTLSDTTM